MRTLPVQMAALAVAALTVAACGGGAPAQQAGGPGRGGGMATPVGIVTLAQKPIEESSDFIATVQSLHSTTIQPQVEGYITKIFVKSGDAVKAGAPLMQIDPEHEAATLRNTEAQRAAREADVKYWTGEVQRLQDLLKAAAISQDEFDTAQHNLLTSQANLGALDAQVKEEQVQLQYYRVTAPTAGVVGDIPVREGDRVTTSSMITTIDDRSGLEAYINVPVDRAPDLRLGLPAEILDADSKVVATNPISFVAPRVDPATQTILAKSRLRDAPPAMRVQQFVRVRVVWRTVPGLTIPIVATNRINGQYFCFVAEQGPNGQLIARQRPVQVGDVKGNDYVVKGGLQAGDKLIVSGVQKIGDGAPVRPQ